MGRAISELVDVKEEEGDEMALDNSDDATIDSQGEDATKEPEDMETDTEEPTYIFDESCGIYRCSCGWEIIAGDCQGCRFQHDIDRSLDVSVGLPQTLISYVLV
jgi:hypothetical protein